MRRKRVEAPIIDNILRLFSKRLEEFRGESKRSYLKAYSSFQLFLISNYPMGNLLQDSMVEDWVIDNIRHGLSRNTVSFYLDKISSLYSGIRGQIIGGKTIEFKEIKKKLKELSQEINYAAEIKGIYVSMHSLWKQTSASGEVHSLLSDILQFDPARVTDENIRNQWASIALYAGIPANSIKGILGTSPSNLDLLDLSEGKKISEEETLEVIRKVALSLRGEEPQWFAMRLRPKVKYENILDRFAMISNEIKMPELFYPMEEIVKKVGSKVVWQGKPVIRDVVFFKARKSEIYNIFSRLYDLAWCYRNPGAEMGNYASIPARAMEDFKKSLGFLSPDFEVAPAGEMKLRPGDEVIIVNGEYARKHAKILKESPESEIGNKIYRVSLMNSNGHWDIGIDARLLKKV